MAANGSGPVDALSGIPVVNAQLCSGCGRCVAACPDHIITLDTIGFHKSAVITGTERCSSCDRCLTACPIAALHN